MTFDPKNMKSLCLLRLSAIGDVCHAVAMVQAIQREYPQLPITWVIGKVEYQLLKHLPGVTFVIFDKSKGWRSYAALRNALAGQKFDVLLHMQVALRATIASLMIKAKVRIGFDKKRAKEGQWLVTNHAISAQQAPHVLDGFMGFAKSIGVKDLTPRWHIPVPQADQDYAKLLIADDENVLVICPAASKAERNWLPERYAAVADHAAQKGYRVILCGGPSELERNLAASIIEHAQCDIDNIIGKTALTQLLAVLKRAKIVVAPDTGPLHMAVTQGTAVIGLYAHSNPGRTGPYLYRENTVSVYPQAIAMQVKGDIPWGKRAKGENLMQMITLDSVIQVFDRISS
ncbi:glycosyltransferase family 9 protein [Shewanella subflava]|uniref:Glycosyltransferase family 9 protein n=1 Tax=Shewanella subflava TaxID=2986476 RepID=A0ABT3I800_9GAMM|nr:glycosyltransferase family 9 protein [Shewanella subflava]MCW3172161.1 glycosyltransferase family 9 protein [Shewanella subflava]